MKKACVDEVVFALFFVFWPIALCDAVANIKTKLSQNNLCFGFCIAINVDTRNHHCLSQQLKL
jgi:hypothetical protein